MNNLTDKDLIHPITRSTYKEPIYKDFVSREEFINQTGIFVSPDYYEYIYDIEYKKSGVSAEEFIRDYDEYSCAMKSHFRKSGNQMSGKWKSSYHLMRVYSRNVLSNP